MQDALLIARDETEQGATQFDRSSLTALFERLGPRKTITRLRPISAASSVRVRGEGLVIADGPFAETKEQILGLVVVDCDALEDVAACGSLSGASAKEAFR